MFLKNFTAVISMGLSSLPVSKSTSFSFLNRAASSVVGNTFTSPRTPWVDVMTPTRKVSSIAPSLSRNRQ